MYLIHEFELEVSRCTFGQQSASINASRSMPAPKCGMMIGTRRMLQRDAVQIERVAEAHVERARQAELLADADRQHAAMREHRDLLDGAAAARGRELEHVARRARRAA